MQSVNINIELLNQIVGYLGSRPYVEVAKIIEAIQVAIQPQLVQQADASKEQ